MPRLNRSDESALLAALSHQLRRRILRRMRGEEMVSPRQMAREFDLPISNIAYHVRVLAGCGAVTLVRVKPVRGSIKHYYRSSLQQPWAQQIIDLEPWNEGGSGETPGEPTP
jgi:DNA-binding transcriptional ArsR family regulator